MNVGDLSVPSISCSTCANKIKNELNSFNGVEKVDIDLKSQNLNVEFNEEIVSLDDVKEKIIKMGYEVF